MCVCVCVKYSYLQIFGDIKQLSDCLSLEDLRRLRGRLVKECGISLWGDRNIHSRWWELYHPEYTIIRC